MSIIQCKLPENMLKEDFNPFPGSIKAIILGCTCPTEQVLWPNSLEISSECKIHKLEKVGS